MEEKWRSIDAIAASGEKDVLYELNIKTKTMKKFEKGHELSKQLLSSVRCYLMLLLFYIYAKFLF